VIVLSPHLDDAALSTYSVLSLGEARVVSVFTAGPIKGEHLSLWDRVCGFDDSVEVARLRRAEDERALATLGIRPTNLGLRDASIRQAEGVPAPSAIQISDWIRDIVADSGERTVYAPLGGGPRPNPDHVIVRDAARLLARLGVIDLVLYADQPYVYKNRSWPGWISPSSNPEPAHTDGEASWWKRFPRDVPEMVSLDEGLRVVELLSQEVDRKLALMKMYETQFENLNRKLRTKDLLRDPALYGVEVFWEIP
jgi:LmbE family N-acetylglucosaminyl deacetylase